MAASRRNRLRILLVAPSALDSHGVPIKQHRLYLPGLTLPMLAAVTPRDCDVSLVFESVDDVPYDLPWDLVGITGMGSGLVEAWRIADRFRARGATVVIGGIAASLIGADPNLEHADAVVVGEAEETWPRVVEDFRNGKLAGVYEMWRTPDIETLPSPRLDLLPARRLGPWRPVQATRGCPFSCDYCSVTAFYRGHYRKRPVEQVLRDVRAAKATGTRYIAFIDDNIAVDLKYCAELWQALVPERIIWMSQCSLHIAQQPELLALAHRSGCRILSVGIESTSEVSLAAHLKSWNVPGSYERAVRTIREHGIDVSTEMMVGMDGDDDSVFDRTYAFLMDNAISVPRIHIMTPVPGTPLFERVRAEQRLLGEDFRKFTGGYVVARPARIDAELLERGYWRLYERLFTLRAIAHRTMHNRAHLEPYMRAFVVGVNFHYRHHIRQRITPGIV